jgi:hypothetical protein
MINQSILRLAWNIAGMGRKIQLCRISVGKPERESSLEELGCRMKFNIKMDLRKIRE